MMEERASEEDQSKLKVTFRYTVKFGSMVIGKTVSVKMYILENSITMHFLSSIFCINYVFVLYSIVTKTIIMFPTQSLAGLHAHLQWSQ